MSENGSYTITVTAKANGLEDVTGQAVAIVGSTDWSTVYTSNVTLTTTGGTSASTAKVKINGADYDAIKAGTGSVAGAMKITVPSGTTKLHIHAAGWKGESVKLDITGATANPSPIQLTSDVGVTGNSPFTLSGNASDYYKEITLSGITTETTLIFTATAGKRFVIWGVNAK